MKWAEFCAHRLHVESQKLPLTLCEGCLLLLLSFLNHSLRPAAKFLLACSLLAATLCQAQTPAPAFQDGYDKALFAPTMSADQIALIRTMSSKTANDAMKDKQFRKLLKVVVPNCEYHYGRDMPLMDALDMVLKGSKEPVSIVGDRYVMISGAEGPYLKGRGFLWFDLQDGIALGGFFFQPTNGEPTPALSVFSKQVTDLMVRTEQLPEAFMSDVTQWSQAYHVPPVTTRYFLTGSNKRILLEHDEDYCQKANNVAPGTDDPCQQEMAYAADLDEVAAYYLVQINYATNGTAWMIGPDQTLWLRTRDNLCGVNAFGCRVRVTREHTHAILHGTGTPRPVAPRPAPRR